MVYLISKSISHQFFAVQLALIEGRVARSQYLIDWFFPAHHFICMLYLYFFSKCGILTINIYICTKTRLNTIQSNHARNANKTKNR